MAQPILSTKLFLPPPRPNLVKRSQLIDSLDNGIRLGRRLTLISAPAGFGKTTLVSDWLCAGCTATWLSLDEADNDPLRFLLYLTAALQKIDAHIGQGVQAALQTPQPKSLSPAFSNLMESLINDISMVSERFLLVLDDYHLIQSMEVHPLVQLLIERQPAVLHTVILTRQDPPLPLPRLRARGQITEIRERDLRFSQDETMAFFHQTMQLNLDPALIATLKARTEGWIAGLQLAAIALQEDPDPSSHQVFIDTFAGSDRYIMDYLTSEVLVRLPERVSDFLMVTSVLERLCGPLCDALFEAEGSANCICAPAAGTSKMACWQKRLSRHWRPETASAWWICWNDLACSFWNVPPGLYPSPG